MASMRKRVSKSGEVTYAVLFRMGNQQKSKTFSAASKPHPPDKFAADFMALVDILGPEKALATIAAQESNGLTVDALFERWMQWKKTTDVTPRTIRDYRRDYDNSIRGPLGGRAAESIDELDVQTWIDKLAATLDPKTVGDRHMILSSMFKFGSAKSRKLVGHNPCLETQLPSKKKKAPKGFTLAEWDAMHAWGSTYSKDADDLLLFIADTGWRFSEVTPLTVAAVEDQGDVDYLGRAIPIVFVSVLGVHRVDDNDRVIYVEGEGKSQAAMRRINLPPESARMIRRRIVGKGPADLVFTNERGSQWRGSTFNERYFNRILAGAGIRKVKGMGAHYLRHSHVGQLDRAGVSLAKTQRRIGHEHISTTIGVYGGMIDNTLSIEELVALDAMTSKPPTVLGEVVSGEVVVSGPDELAVHHPSDEVPL